VIGGWLTFSLSESAHQSKRTRPINSDTPR
jgi:hypothetical protein